jgi:hypothetical protein
MRRSFVLILLVIAFNASAAESNLSKTVVGTWKLQNFYYKDATNQLKPWCINPNGYLIYTKENVVSASIQCEGANAEDEAKGYPKEIFYAGTYEYKGGDLFMHKSIVDLNRKNLNQEKERHVSIKNNDLLTITGQGLKGPFLIEWKRLK